MSHPDSLSLVTSTPTRNARRLVAGLKPLPAAGAELNRPAAKTVELDAFLLSLLNRVFKAAL